MENKCKGINCTSDGMTPHSSQCIAEHLLATLGISLSQVLADAQRYNGVRMVICEQDEMLRERMGEAMATEFEAWTDTLTHEAIVAPEAFNAMIDAALLAACEARK